MKFNVKYTKFGNQFFFISNLAEWHFSCRTHYNEEWLKKTGPLNKEEKEALQDISKILKKYGFEQYLGKYFFIENNKDVWGKVKKYITDKEYKKTREVFDVLENRFEKIWDPSILKDNIKIFKKESGRFYYKKIDEYLKNFFGKYDRKKKINIFLLRHPIDNWYVAGGANLGGKGITLECNQLIYPKDASVEVALATAYHEFIHMAYQKKIEKIIDKIVKNEQKNIFLTQPRSLKKIIIELIINSFFPRGYLANKYLHYQPYKNIERNLEKYKNSFYLFRNGKGGNFNEWRYYIIYQLYPLIKIYMENKKKIDKEYINSIISYLKK